MKRPALRHQRGAVTLSVTLALLAAMLITLWAANRHLLLEWRQSLNQAHAAAAFEAAEAGLDWATAMLNDGARIGNDCRPSPLSTQSFREQQLDTSLPAFTPRGLHPACARGAAGWQCSCGGAAVAAADGEPAFRLRIDPGPSTGQLQISASGSQRDAGALHTALVELQPALPHPPAAALTVKPNGESPDTFFVRHFGLSRTQWLRQPAVRHLDCEGDCGAALAVLADQGATLVALPGQLLLRGPLALGTPQRPMLIVVAGQLQLQGAVQLQGVVHAAAIGWSAPAASVRGALISDGPASGDSSLALERDAAVLDALQTRQGSFVRLPGSWRDF